jgi:hypothetical protein
MRGRGGRRRLDRREGPRRGGARREGGVIRPLLERPGDRA